MTALRILLTTDVVGGVWDFSIQLATALDTRFNARVTLLAFGEPGPRHREAAADAAAQLVSAPLKLEWMQDAGADILRALNLTAQVARDTRAQVVHANHFVAACAPLDVPTILTLHSDVFSWSRWTRNELPAATEWVDYRRVVDAALQKADRITAVSAFLANEARQLYSVTQPIEVIHNGWPASEERQTVEEPPRTLLAGRIWDPAKNIHLAARAAQGWTPGPVILAGDTRHPESGISADVPAPLQSVGFLAPPAMAEALERAAIYLSPARYDPFGLLPLQAALSGCALLLSDIPSYRELWDGAACFFRADDAADLREQWQRLLQSPHERMQLREHARHRAVQRYTPERMVDAYMRVYARARSAVPA